jgi:D-alanyl-lipoteichoic acid acyltransferase DltB (MBOAT superfamily)
VSTVYAQIGEKPVARKELPVYLILAGLAACIAFGADVLGGIARIGNLSQGQIGFIGAAFAVLTSGLVLDLAVGQRLTADWLKDAAVTGPDLAKLLLISLELGLLTLVIREFQIGNQSFYEGIAVLTFLGFLIHSVLPLEYRLPFFLLLSLLGIQSVLGWSAAGWLIGIGLVLIGLCHLPIAFPARVVLILATGAFLALLRTDRVIQAPSLRVIWPVLGSMFMFRLVVYLYDMRHEKSSGSITTKLSYFFLLPNVAFPLFPVVDYKTFRRTYYDTDHQDIYQRGVEWIFRGVFQLILYRIVYNYMTLSPADVTDIGGFIRFVVSNFALYLRVSGLFHLIVGMLHLFGFHLPETHHRYFLASSFTDFWRRINIYWKDFMMKVFFYPTYFRLKKLGTTTALIISTLVVFLCTWLLHSYQWFWLRGTFPITLMDVLFWSILGILVVMNSLYEMKYGRKRSLGKQERNVASLALLALRTVGTFAFICLLWSLWTSTSLSEWLSLWHISGKTAEYSAQLIPVVLVVAVVVGGLPGNGAASEMAKAQGTKSKQVVFFQSVAFTGVSILLFLLVGNPAVYSRLGLRAQEMMRDIRIEGLNKRDSALLRRGYYENLMGVERFNSQLWEVYMRRPSHWPDINETEASRPTDNLLRYELRPLAGITFKGKPFRTNRWGMRDQDHAMKKPPKTYRYAVLGASPEMGSGVADNETFKSFLEERLNRENISSKSLYARYEILNFAVGGYTPLENVWLLEHKVFDFEPDAVFYVAHPNDEDAVGRHLARSIHENVEIPYDYLKDLLHKANVDRNTPLEKAGERLKPFQAEIISWAYRTVVQDCRQRGVQPIFIFLGTPGENTSQDVIDFHVRLAQEAGFTTINLQNWFENQDLRRMIVEEWDRHPSAEGHKLIADKLYDALRQVQRTPAIGHPIL